GAGELLAFRVLQLDCDTVLSWLARPIACWFAFGAIVRHNFGRTAHPAGRRAAPRSVHTPRSPRPTSHFAPPRVLQRTNLPPRVRWVPHAPLLLLLLLCSLIALLFALLLVLVCSSSTSCSSMGFCSSLCCSMRGRRSLVNRWSTNANAQVAT